MKVAVAGRSERLAVVGTFPRVPVGARVRVRGTIVHDKKHGEQLRAESVTELAPSTLVGIERYLGSGMIKGIGEAYAKKIVAAFGLDTLRVLDEQPDRLREVEGLGAKRADAILKRLRRVEGQVRGIAGMVEDERYCIDVLQQISAAQAALDKVAIALVDDHVRHCVMEADASNQEEMRAELMTALSRMVGRR